MAAMLQMSKIDIQTLRRAYGRVKTEDDPLDPNPPHATRRTLEAIRRLEALVSGVSGMTGIVLRYGSFYGPGTSIAPDGDIVRLIRRRKFPIVGNGAGVWSSIHIDDAAEATRLAIERGPSGRRIRSGCRAISQDFRGFL